LGARRGLLRDLPAVLERLLPGLTSLLLDLVGERSDPLVLQLRPRHRHPGEEADREPADGEPERVFLDDPGGALRALLDFVAARHALGDIRARPADPRAQRLYFAADRVFGTRRHVGFVAEGVDGLAHVLARVLYLLPDDSWV